MDRQRVENSWVEIFSDGQWYVVSETDGSIFGKLEDSGIPARVQRQVVFTETVLLNDEGVAAEDSQGPAKPSITQMRTGLWGFLAAPGREDLTEERWERRALARLIVTRWRDYEYGDNFGDVSFMSMAKVVETAITEFEAAL